MEALSGDPMTHAHDNASLPSQSRVDQYVIERKIGGGGFSIVYVAHEAGSKQQVVIKEYMPRKLALRKEDGCTIYTRDGKSAETFAQGRRLFFQEASTLAKLKHPNIVNVISFFRANGTVYMVMEYEKGLNMQEYIRRHDGNLSEKLIRTVFPALLDGLKLIHGKGLLHLDIKPGNIYLRHGGNPLLLDFGAVHEMMQSRRDQPTQVITPGFSPIEQLRPGGYVGPWTDMYALGATMRACIEGCAPPPSTERELDDTMRPAAVAFRKHYSQSLLKTIDWAMEIDPLARPQQVDELLQAMNVESPQKQTVNESMLERLTSSLPWNKG